MECNSLSITGLEDSLAICLGAMDTDELQEYVMLQVSFESEQSDGQLYLELNDQSCSTYGGILKCIISSEVLTLHLSNAAALELGLEEGPSEMTVKLSLPEEEIEELTYALNEVVFQGQDTLEVQGL
jgi:hypothetical protein